MNMTGFARRFEKTVIDNSPTILTAVGVVGTVTTALLTGRATAKALLLVMDEEREQDRALQDKEIIQLVWKEYIPPVTIGTFTIVSIIGANHISGRRATAVAAAYSLSERAFAEYKEKVIERVGKKKERSFRDEIAQDRVNNDPPKDGQVIITGNGDVLCYDHFTGRYFQSSMEALRKAENDINFMILHDGYACVSDFYDLLELPATSFSEEVGWNYNRKFQLVYSTVMSPDNRPCIAIDFDLHPNRKYAHFAE